MPYRIEATGPLARGAKESGRAFMTLVPAIVMALRIAGLLAVEKSLEIDLAMKDIAW